MAGTRDSKHYNEAQVQAILTAKWIDGTNGAEIVRLAAKGELGGLKAFRIDKHYVYTLIRKHREEFEAENPAALARRTHTAVTNAHKANLTALEDLATDTDPAERARVTDAVIKTAKALQTTEPRPQAKQTRDKPNEPVNTPATSDVANDLLRLAPKPTSESARTSSLSPARIEPDAA